MLLYRKKIDVSDCFKSGCSILEKYCRTCDTIFSRGYSDTLICMTVIGMAPSLNNTYDDRDYLL